MNPAAMPPRLSFPSLFPSSPPSPFGSQRPRHPPALLSGSQEPQKAVHTRPGCAEGPQPTVSPAARGCLGSEKFRSRPLITAPAQGGWTQSTPHLGWRDGGSGGGLASRCHPAGQERTSSWDVEGRGQTTRQNFMYIISLILIPGVRGGGDTDPHFIAEQAEVQRC